MPTTTETKTSHGLLQLQWREAEMLQTMGVKLEDISKQFDPVDMLVGLSQAIATEFKPEAPSFERSRKFLPKVQQTSFGSPLFLSVEVSHAVIASVGALSFLIYGAKRISGLDLELRTHREDLRTRFYEAQERAAHAQRRVEELVAQEDFRHEVVGREQGWGRDASTVVHASTVSWEGEQAILHVDDE